ncbi:hypothetical protein [Thauera sp.]|uniref:hypothetical protein n=1 Tax=Thauera sp. TaxID=1905334 RepID=UPI0039E617E0
MLFDESHRLRLAGEVDRELLLAAFQRQPVMVEDQGFRGGFEGPLLQPVGGRIAHFAAGHERGVEQREVAGLDEAGLAAGMAGQRFHQLREIEGGGDGREAEQAQQQSGAQELDHSRCQKGKKLNQL